MCGVWQGQRSGWLFDQWQHTGDQASWWLSWAAFWWGVRVSFKFSIPPPPLLGLSIVRKATLLATMMARVKMRMFDQVADLDWETASLQCLISKRGAAIKAAIVISNCPPSTLLTDGVAKNMNIQRWFQQWRPRSTNEDDCEKGCCLVSANPQEGDKSTVHKAIVSLGCLNWEQYRWWWWWSNWRWWLCWRWCRSQCLCPDAFFVC